MERPNKHMIESDKLLELLKQNPKLTSDPEALVHALSDIAGSIDKIYSEILPHLLSEPKADIDVLKDRLWDLREEFRHVDYHIHDSGVLEL